MSRRSRQRLLIGTGFLLALAFVYRPLLAGEVLSARDIFRLYGPDAWFLREQLLAGELPLWVPFGRLGQPFLATIQSQALYPLRVIPVLLFGPYPGLTVEHLLHLVVAFAGTSLAARRLGASRPASALAGVAMALGHVMTHVSNAQNIANAFAWTGFIAAAAIRLGARPGLRPAALLAGSTALSFLCGSPEVLLWQLALAVALAWSAAGERRARRTRAAVAVGGAAGWGVLGLAAFTALPAVEFALNSARSGGEAAPLRWSANPSDLLSMFWPGANLPAAHLSDDQVLILTLYQGTLLHLFALAALTSRRARRRYLPLLLVGAAFLLLSLGANFGPSAWLLQQPPLNLFRYPVKYALAATFVASLLSARGLDRLAALARRTLPRRGALLLAFAIPGAVALVGLPIASRWMREGAAPGLAFLLFSVAVGAALFSRRTGPPARRAATQRYALGALAVGELLLLHVAVGPPPTQPAQLFAQASRLGSAIGREEGWGRVAVRPSLVDGAIDVEEARSDGTEQVRRFIAASRDLLVPNRFFEDGLHLLNGYGSPEPARVFELSPLDSPRAVHDFAGVRWYVDEAPPFDDLEPVGCDGCDGLPKLWRSRSALPRAFVVHRAQVASDAEALAALRDPAQPFRQTAWLAEGSAVPALTDCTGSSATIAEAAAGRLRIDVESCGAGLLLVTDAWFPGWVARVGDVPAEVLRADFVARAVAVPPGRSTVELRYSPRAFWIGAALSLLSLVLLLAVLGGAFSPAGFFARGFQGR